MIARSGFIRGGAGALAFAPVPARAQAAPIKLRVGTGTVEADAQIFYAQDMGFFKKNGLDIEIVKLRSGTTTMAAIAAGDLQCGIANVMSLGAAHLRNVPLVLIAPGAFSDSSVVTTAFVVGLDSTIGSAKDLAGKTVATISLGGLDQLAVDAWVDKAGVDYTTVKCLEVPPSTMAAALAQGRIACALMNDPELAQALESKLVKSIGPAYDAIAKVFMQTAWFSQQDWLDKNKDVAKRFGDALVQGGLWGMANPEPAGAILSKYTGAKEARTKTRFATKLDPALIQPVYDFGLKYKLIAGAVSAASFSWNGK